MKTLFISVSIFCLTSISVFARDKGFDSGNAGDAFSAEFLFSARDVLQRLEILERSGERLTDTSKLRSAIETTKVVSQDRVYLDGLERDAVNYPAQNLIILGRERWKALRAPSETRARLILVAHEFLWIMGVDDTNFAQSQKIMDRLNVPAYSPGIWLNSSGLPFATAECAGRLRDGSIVTVKVFTKGATKSPDGGSVEIAKGGNRFGYRFRADEVAQFFENDDAKSNQAMVGLNAYVAGEFPVSVKYNGKNFVDMDLRAVLESGENNSVTANTMQVWKGPGYKADDFYRFTKPVCSVDSNN
jgi:hypothetical protein